MLKTLACHVSVLLFSLSRKVKLKCPSTALLMWELHWNLKLASEPGVGFYNSRDFISFAVILVSIGSRKQVKEP